MPEYRFLQHPGPHQTQEILALYKAEGWWTASLDDRALIGRIVSGSHCFLVVESDDRIIGMGRAISDGTSDGYIQDVAVSDGWRGRGIGTAIVRRLLDRLEADGVNWIGLIAERCSHGFYRRLGFEIMKNSTPMVRLTTTAENQ